MEIYAISKESPITTIGSLTTYKSLIWTERYGALGEFELKTLDIRQGKQQLPKGAIVGARFQGEDPPKSHLMMVETHSIEENDDGVLELTITGRALESFAENRVARWALTNATDTWVESEFPPYWYSVAISQPWRYAFSAYNQLLEFWDKIDFIQNVRNEINPADGALIIPYPPAPDDITTDSVVYDSKDWYGNMAQMMALSGFSVFTEIFEIPGVGEDPPSQGVRLVVYKGTDRSNEIVFDVDDGMFLNPKYLTSIVDHKNIAYVFDTVKGRYHIAYGEGASAESRGFDRRILFVDGSDITITAEPARTNALNRRGLEQLAEHRERSVFDGTLNANLSLYKFATDYNLGDLVKVKSEKMDFTKTMRVSEYIRVKDDNGYTEYPTLVEYS